MISWLKCLIFVAVSVIMLTDIYVLPPDSDERTFQYDKNLPSLPLPSLSDTLNRYLESVEPLVTEEEYKKTEEIVKGFENGIGIELQKKLKLRASEEKNWVKSIDIIVILDIILCENKVHFRKTYL